MIFIYNMKLCLSIFILLFEIDSLKAKSLEPDSRSPKEIDEDKNADVFHRNRRLLSWNPPGDTDGGARATDTVTSTTTTSTPEWSPATDPATPAPPAPTTEPLAPPQPTTTTTQPTTARTTQAPPSVPVCVSTPGPSLPETTSMPPPSRPRGPPFKDRGPHRPGPHRPGHGPPRPGHGPPPVILDIIPPWARDIVEKKFGWQQG